MKFDIHKKEREGLLYENGGGEKIVRKLFQTTVMNIFLRSRWTLMTFRRKQHLKYETKYKVTNTHTYIPLNPSVPFSPWTPSLPGRPRNPSIPGNPGFPGGPRLPGVPGPP